MEVPTDLRLLTTRQAGVVSRRQALAAGLRPSDVRRLLRRRELAPLLPGVYVDHTGPPGWDQRAWASVLAVWPAALHGASALRAFDGPQPGRSARRVEVVHVAIDRTRSRPAHLPGVRVHQVARFDDEVLWNLGPPRQRYAVAALAAACGEAGELDAIAVLARACGTRGTTATQLAVVLAGRPRVARRAFLEAVLDDLATGTCSVLEHAYLDRVERPHGLPPPQRQQRERAVTGVLYRDAVHGSAVVELDGRLFHTGVVRRDDDLERDLDVAADGRATVRLGAGQVLARPCRTAGKVAAFLRHHGVVVEPHPCGQACDLRGPLP